MAAAPDLMGLLSLDPSLSRSPFGGNHRFILIEKDFTNSGDFVFNSLLQHFGRREPNTQVLLVTLSHNWINYSVGAAKCGFNLRKKQNMGNIDILNIMDKFLASVSCDSISVNFCDLILNKVNTFLDDKNTQPPKSLKNTIVMIDDLSLLLTMDCSLHDVTRLVLEMDRLLRYRSQNPSDRHNHLIIQTMSTNIKANLDNPVEDRQLNFLTKNLENICDMHLTLKPLETGYSTRVDGTITFIDNRVLAKQNNSSKGIRPSIFANILSSEAAEIGSRRAYFYKLSDRRVRLTSSAFIF